MADREQDFGTPDQPGAEGWMPEEYEAGYRSRLENTDEFKTATYCWRAGWQDADRELRASGHQEAKEMMNEAAPAQWSSYGTGRLARICGLPFDADRSDAWKQSWVQTDIELSLRGTQAPS